MGAPEPDRPQIWQTRPWTAQLTRSSQAGTPTWKWAAEELQPQRGFTNGPLRGRDRAAHRTELSSCVARTPWLGSKSAVLPWEAVVLNYRPAPLCVSISCSVQTAGFTDTMNTGTGQGLATWLMAHPFCDSHCRLRAFSRVAASPRATSTSSRLCSPAHHSHKRRDPSCLSWHPQQACCINCWQILLSPVGAGPGTVRGTTTRRQTPGRRGILTSNWGD